MKYLLDTHIAIWALSRTNRLSQNIKDILTNPDNQIYYSTASIWEVEIKHLKNPSSFTLSGKQLSFLLDQANAVNLQIKNEHIEYIKEINAIDLKIKHNDPFDKLLLAQAISEKMILITADEKFKNYSNSNILVI